MQEIEIDKVEGKGIIGHGLEIYGNGGRNMGGERMKSY